MVGRDLLLAILSAFLGVFACLIILEVTGVSPEEGANIGGGMVCISAVSFSLGIPGYVLQRRWEGRFHYALIPLLAASMAVAITALALTDLDMEELPGLTLLLLGSGLVGAGLGRFGDWRRRQLAERRRQRQTSD